MKYSQRWNLNGKVYSLKQELSEQNVWYEKATFWKDVWFSVQIATLKSEKRQYLFIARWDESFPEKFKVSFPEGIFSPINEPIIDRKNE